MFGYFNEHFGNDRQNAREFGIGIIGNSKGIFGQALPPPPRLAAAIPPRLRSSTCGCGPPSHGALIGGVTTLMCVDDTGDGALFDEVTMLRGVTFGEMTTLTD